MLDAVKLGLLVFISVVLVGGLAGAFVYMRHLTRQIIGEVRAAGLVRAALHDEFGPPPAVPVRAAVQGGRHRDLHLVGSRGPVTRFVMQRLFTAV